MADKPTDVTFNGPLEITVPNGVNYVSIDGTASFIAGTGTTAMVLWAAADSPNCAGISGVVYENRTYGEITNTAGSAREVQSYHLIPSVTPGVHSYRLCAYGGGSASTLFTRGLSVTTVPAGPTG